MRGASKYTTITKKAAAMDISAACAGFVYGLSLALQFIANGTYKYILVIGAGDINKLSEILIKK